MEPKFTDSFYESPECATLDVQVQAVLCSSVESQKISDFTFYEDVWN